MTKRENSDRAVAAKAEPAEAEVYLDGEVREIASGEGARFLRENRELLVLCQQFLRGPETDLRFYWTSGAQWFQVDFSRERGVDRRERVVVAIVERAIPFGVTARELDVLTLVAGGLSNNEVAAELVNSVRTVATHVAHLLRKTNLSNRAALAALSGREGIFRLPTPARIASDTSAGLHPAALLSRSEPNRVGRGRVERAPLVVGTAIPLQGLGSADGFEMRNGAALAIQEINARGGVGGRPLRQIVTDVDISNPTSITRSFEKLIESEVDAITSGYFFADQDVIDLAINYGAPYLHAMTSEASVTPVVASLRPDHPVFQVCPSENLYGHRFIGLLDELTESGAWKPPNRDLMFIDSAVPGGQMVNLETARSAERSGWNLAHTSLLPQQVSDWDSIVQDVHKVGPAAAMVTHFVPEQLAAFQRAFVRAPVPCLLYSVYTPSIPEFERLAGPTAEGLLWSTVSGTYGDQLGSGFQGRYQQAFGRPPGRSHAGIAYDEIHLLAQAWARVENPRSFTAVARQLRASTYRGVNGSYYLDNREQSGLSYPDATLDPSLGQAHLIFQIQEGRSRVLSPAPYTEAKFRPPPWLGSVKHAETGAAAPLHP